ncbi:MAG: RIP metalloprotease RseP [Kiritimatiellia bacterium]|jgi:regulator of sigma E protease
MEILPFLLKICAGIVVALLFGLAVFIHEFGHFLAARLLGLRVDVFSIGFGPAIWKWRRNGIEYRICWIPLGGYVALPQLDPEGMDKIQGGPAEAADAAPLPPIAPWRRIVVAFAGPFGNAVLAVALAWILYAMPHAYTAGPDTFVGDVVAGSPAAEAGFRPDDRILAVNGAPVAGWNDFAVECHLSGDVTNGVVVRVARDGRELDLPVPVAKDPESGILRIQGLSRKVACLVGQVGEASPAAGAGILPGDRIVACNGAVLGSPAHMIQCISAAGETPVTLAILRGGKTLSLTLTPRFDPELERPLIGILFADPDARRSPWLLYRDPWRQLRADAGSIARILRALVAPRAKGEAGRAASALGGPVMIFFLLWHQVMAGLANSLAFLRFLCVNLAILNLLPLPVLDGGHILFALWELVTRRKPGAKFVALLTNAFAILLIGLMLLLVFRDVLSLSRLFRPRAPSAATATSAIEAEAGEAR